MPRPLQAEFLREPALGVIMELMSTLAEIEAAIEHLPAPQLDELWLERRSRKPATPASEPDFLARVKAIWGDAPAGEPLSALVSEARG